MIIKRWIYYFFEGVRVIAGNKILVIVIFCMGVFLLNKTLCYREELLEYKSDYLEESVVSKEGAYTDYYYDEVDNDSSISKQIAASSLVSCINSDLSFEDIGDNINNIMDELNDLFSENDDYYSFLYKDIYTGFTVSYNEEGSIFTASTIKAPAMIYLYEEASKGNIDLDELLTYTEGFYSSGSGVLRTKEFNTVYSVDTLIEYAIHDSDNIAYSMLMNRFGRENILSFWSSLGCKNIFKYDTIWGYTSAKDASIYMQELYDFYLSNDEYGDKLMDYFKNAEWKMITNIDGEYNTANKGGWSDASFHDVAIVFEENPYILVIMSNAGEDYSSYNYLFTTVSKLVGELHKTYWQVKMDKCSEIEQY